MLTIRQQAIKKYVTEAHEEYRRPTIKQIADAFTVSPATVRYELAAIRRDRRDSMEDLHRETGGFFRGIFD